MLESLRVMPLNKLEIPIPGCESTSLPAMHTVPRGTHGANVTQLGLSTTPGAQRPRSWRCLLRGPAMILFNESSYRTKCCRKDVAQILICK